jgi:hypothetical protein
MPAGDVPWKWGADLPPLTLAALVGLLLAVLPHLYTWATYGTPEHLADGDEVYYLAAARVPYGGEWRLRDPFARPEEQLPTPYSWLSFVPMARLTRALGLPLLLNGLVWRSLGGLMRGASFFALFRSLFADLPNSRAWALGCALICLGDAGLINRTLADTAVMARAASAGRTEALGDATLPQYRVITPLTNLAPLLLLAALVASRWRGWVSLGCGCILLALCVYLYFFFWTAAVVGLLGYAGLRLLFRNRIQGDHGRHWKEAGFVLAVVAGGLLLGAPQILSNQQLFSDPAFRPALDRMCKGCPVPPDSPVRTMYLGNWWAWGGIAVGVVATVWLRRPGLLLLTAFTAGGFLLHNSAALSGLEFENFHWNYVTAPFREVLVLACVGLLLARLRLRRPTLIALAAVVLLFPAVGGWLRVWQTAHAAEPVKYRKVLSELNDVRPALSGLSREDVLAGPFEANVAILFGQPGQLYQFNYSSHGSLIDDQTVHERFTLNVWLQGSEELTYSTDPFQEGVVTRPEWELESVHRQRLAIFQQLQETGGGELLGKYSPTHLLLPAMAPAPSRGGPWVLLGKGKHWALWVCRRDT